MPQNHANSGVTRSNLFPRLSLAAASLLAFSACLQTEPAGPDPDIETPIEDNGRTAGASSSTNWPAEFGFDKHRATWNFDSILRIEFHDRNVNTGSDFPVKRKGSIHIHPGKVVPALDTVPDISWDFEETQSLGIPTEKILLAARGTSDTILFNLRMDLDTLFGWFLSFQYERSTGKIVESASSPFPITNSYLKKKDFFFQGALSQVTSLLPEPAGSNPEISFYIPGTPNFCKAHSDSFHLGPIPGGIYPLRVARISDPAVSNGGTLVEIWELRVSGIAGAGSKSTFTLGEQVLSFQSKGKLTLRNEE